jgi:hypothetical protein
MSSFAWLIMDRFVLPSNAAAVGKMIDCGPAWATFSQHHRPDTAAARRDAGLSFAGRNVPLHSTAFALPVARIGPAGK